MRGYLKLAAVAAIVLLVGAPGSGGIGARSCGFGFGYDDGDLDGLERASADWDRLFNSGDMKALADQYTDDAESMPPNGPTVLGKTAIRVELEKLVADATVHHTTSGVNLRSSSGLGVERANYEMTFTPKSGGPQTRETGRHVMVRMFTGDRWLIVSEIWNSDQSLSLSLSPKP